MSKDNNSFFIICDFDDTMVDLLSAWVKWLNSQYNYNIKVDDIKDWDMTKAFVGLSQEDMCNCFTLPEFWLTVEAKPDAATYIKKLIDEGFNFNICTATDYRIAKIKFENCLFRLFPFIDRHQIMLSYCKPKIDCDIIIDDYLKNLIDAHGIKILMDAPHNQISNNIEDFRVYSWRTIYEIIHEFANIRKKSFEDETKNEAQ